MVHHVAFPFFYYLNHEPLDPKPINFQLRHGELDNFRWSKSLFFSWTWTCKRTEYFAWRSALLWILQGAQKLRECPFFPNIVNSSPNELSNFFVGGGGGGGNLQQNRASDSSSCERMRSACLHFVWTHAQCMPEVCTANMRTWWRVRAAAPRTAYRSAAALQRISAAAVFVDVMSVTCLFFLFFFLQFFGRLGELVDLQRYGLCEIFESKAESKDLRNWGSCVMSKMWGSLIASPSSTTSKFPSCRAQALLSRLIVEIFRAEGRYFWFRGFFFEVMPW